MARDNSFFGFCNDAPLPSPSDDPAAQGFSAARVDNATRIADLSSEIASLQKRVINETQPCRRRTLRRSLKTLRHVHALAVQQYDNATRNIFCD